ncbi:hypothetical protein EYF80_051176 [Liparis tanakae]|uniref:Uncharacterized protein n=1 Tax=Liparis tanakae TaxID=230148 RepID=A0A4Z2FBU5_9TELE|nr:hypothetical protein EYF80_051176 [Liparis tanakae]
MSLHCSCASSRAQMRNEPPILRWSEYVSSGGGVSRCLSITGMRLWILCVVDWEPNSKPSAEAKASPRIITASTRTHPVRLRVVEEVGPVGVGLHESELKQLPEAQQQDVVADLEEEEEEEDDEEQEQQQRIIKM